MTTSFVIAASVHGGLTPLSAAQNAGARTVHGAKMPLTLKVSASYVGIRGKVSHLVAGFLQHRFVHQMSLPVNFARSVFGT